MRTDQMADRLENLEAMKANLVLGSGMDELQRLIACMIGTAAPGSLAHEAVVGMELDLFQQGWPVGQSLGALPDVQKRFGLGRPASHAAIKILEARGLLHVRRGPGGGVFVAAPALEDVAGAVLMQLALAGGTLGGIEEFRLLVWRMIVNAAIQRGVTPLPGAAQAGQSGFAANLAEQVGNKSMALLARLAETLMQIAHSGAPQAPDQALETAIRAGDLAAAFVRLDELVGMVDRDSAVIAFDVAERGFSISGRKSAMALAAQMARELSGPAGAKEAEWETAERLGYTDAVVRQARRILQDFGIARFSQGRKGAQLALPAAPTGVIRLLASCLVVNAPSSADKLEAVFFLVSSATVLAARRVNTTDGAPDRLSEALQGIEDFEALALENLIVEMSGNPLLVIVVRSLALANLFLSSVPLVPPKIGDTVTINRRILSAIERGDVATANELAWTKFAMVRKFLT